jgi:hypothetical protein
MATLDLEVHIIGLHAALKEMEARIMGKIDDPKLVAAK